MRTLIVAVVAAGVLVFMFLVLLAFAPPLREHYPLASALIREPAMAGVRSLRDHVRTYERIRASRPVIENYLSTHPEPKLQIGAGPNNLPGWLNTDIEPGQDQAYLNATKPFPLPDRTFHCVTSEHVFEHLSYADGKRMLQECYRILKPGGRLRIATPDLEKFVGLFSSQQTPEKAHYLDQKRRRWKWPQQQTDRSGFLNLMFSSWGHRFLYDPDTLRDALATAGFQSIQQFPAGESGDPVLQRVEVRTEGPYKEANLYETLVFEAVRP
jgi:predicted SAM-dependent methyltransferase